MPDARIDSVCDLVKAAIEAGVTVGDGTTVTTDDPYGSIVDPDAPNAATGRVVWVFPNAEAQIAQASKTKQLNGYTISVQTIARYPEAGEPPSEWVRQERKWVQDYVRDLLSPARGCPVTGYYCEQSTWTVPTDWELLRSLKLFFSTVDFEFRIVE